jgi:hypothetical protein
VQRAAQVGQQGQGCSSRPLEGDVGEIKGLPPGKYRIALEHLKKKQDLFKGAFSGKRTPIVREVTGSDEIVIDLDHPAS